VKDVNRCLDVEKVIDLGGGGYIAKSTTFPSNSNPRPAPNSPALSAIEGPAPESCRRAAADPLAAGSAPAKPQPHAGATLESQSGAALLLVDPDRPLLVRIVRVGGRPLDDDNLAGGCKELRDAIAAALGRRGDSKADGLRWEYQQEPGEVGTRIEITELVTHGMPPLPIS